MRVLMLAQFYPPDLGGEERHVRNLARALVGRGGDVVDAVAGCGRGDGVGHGEVVADVRCGGWIVALQWVRLREVERVRQGTPIGVEVIGIGHAFGQVGDAETEHLWLRSEGLENVEHRRERGDVRHLGV